MVDAIAKAAGVPGDITRRALMLSGDLTRTAEIAIADGEAGLREVGFEIFRPVLPMLASSAPSLPDAVGSFDRTSVEWKLDGIRIQIHRRDDEIRIYTRNLNDITDVLPGIVGAVRALPLSQAVFDGEALWMGEHGPAAFQDTVSRIDSAAPPEGVVTFLFDVLHVDGDDLLDTPLEQRAARLEAIAPHLRIPSVITSDPVTAAQVLDDALQAGHEGVVAKDAASLYWAGRRGKAWRKVKPVRTQDLVVLGAEWGHGRRRGWLSNLHLGALDPRTGELVMVGKCFKGLTDELLEWQTRELLARETGRRHRGAGAPGARGRDRPGRRTVLDSLSGRRGAALRAREALSPGQEPRGSGHHRRPARTLDRTGNVGKRSQSPCTRLKMTQIRELSRIIGTHAVRRGRRRRARSPAGA
jgi:DNA ligase-1